MSLTESAKKELSSLVSEAMAEAMKVSALECPDCHATFKELPKYVDHRIGDYMTQRLAEIQAPTPEALLTECKDGICKIIEETYNVTKKGEAPEIPQEEEVPGLFSTKDEPEE